MFITLLAVLLSVASPSPAQENQTGYLCYGSLPIQAPSEIPLEFRWLSFDSWIQGSSGGVTVLNKSDKGIQYYVAIIEFSDGDGKYLLSVPVYNVDKKDQSIPLNVAFKPWLLANWPGSYMAPIGRQSESDKTFHSVLSTLTCPKSAHVSMVQLRYDDGTEFKYISPTLNLSTAPTSRLDISDSKGAERWLPLTVSGTLQVDSEGHVRILDLDFAAAGFKKWLEREFSHWSFTPAWTNGAPASTVLPFLFILGDTTNAAVQVDVLKRKGIAGPILIWPNIN